MSVLKILTVLFLASSTVFGLSIVSKTDFEDAASTADAESSASENKPGDFLLFEPKNRTKMRTREYIPIVLKRNDRRIEARIPVIITKGKSTATQRPVPIIRGAAVPLRSDKREVVADDIEGLHPPSKISSDRWYLNQENNPNYANSNGYYPNVNGPYSTTLRPVYGVPSPNPTQPSWNCPSMNWGSQNGANYPPNNYPPQGSYPQNQGYPNYPNNPYPMNNYPSHQYPTNHGGGNSWGNNPNWQNSNWGSQAQPWNSQPSGRWIPCGPIDLTGSNGHKQAVPSCVQNSRSANPIRFEPSPSPTSKIDDKTHFNQIPDDVEEIAP